MNNQPTIDANSAALWALDEALAQGDLREVRRQLAGLGDDERATLRLELGDAAYDQVYRTVRRAAASRSRGKVIVLHGIMGGRLAVRRKRDIDNVWINYWRLATGRIADLELDAQGAPRDPAVEVLVRGQQKKYYLPMVLRLDQRWDVKPFAYDWRKDIRESAVGLADTIRAFAGDDPVHLVAHSMGGLVSRYMMQLFPDLWRGMADGDDLARGGRLIMLGTPNHGSYSIPIALTGAEKQLKLLARLDLNHGLDDIVRITNSFAGSYQMLPSPLLQTGDDHARLFRQSTWGDKPVHQHLLQRAKEFHNEIADAVDPARFVYVAGYNRDTPHRMRVDGPGEFSYQMTRDGDGRVPHELGLLNGVPTWWVDATHGDLARNADVLASIDDLLQTGKTSVLRPQRPASRAAEDSRFRAADQFETIEPEILELLNSETRSARPRATRLTGEQQLQLENALAQSAVGGAAQADQQATRGPTAAKVATPRPAMRVEVVWGDITEADGDVFTVGHYQGVLPQAAELAIDAAISNDRERHNLDGHVLRQHTLRGTLRGALGDVDFFPWSHTDGSPRVAAVAGMGRIGAFTPSALRTMARTLVWAVSGLQNVETVCTVLIGSGEGALSIDDALDGLVLGIGDALSGDIANASSAIKTVRIVELFRDRAERIHGYLEDNRDRFASYLELDVPGSVTRGSNARMRDEDGLSLVLDAAMLASLEPRGSRKNDMFEALLTAARRKGIRKSELRRVLQGAARTSQAHQGRAPHFFVSREPARGDDRVPFRLSYLTDGSDIRAAAISDTATVSERVLRFDRKLVEEVSNEVMDVDAPLREATPDFLRNLVVPQAFRELIDRGEAFVFEVDRHMAQVPWEILAAGSSAQDTMPLAIRAQVSRQLRTLHSGRPGVADHRGTGLRALVIGDPGDPAHGDNLPGAQAEAIAVHDLLSSRDVEVDLLVGALDTRRSGRLRDFPAATRVRVMERLMRNRYDILHYCGHGDFDPDDTSRAGWLFADGLLTAYELERISRIPAFVVANACLSGRTSERTAGAATVQRVRDELALLPSLADEFFRRGVINYVGTAWEVSDEGAVLFATELYGQLIPQSAGSGRRNRGGATVGNAILSARRLLYKRSDVYGKLWAAYQHYGDPTSPM